jgi:hypothetical protein
MYIEMKNFSKNPLLVMEKVVFLQPARERKRGLKEARVLRERSLRA